MTKEEYLDRLAKFKAKNANSRLIGISENELTREIFYEVATSEGNRVSTYFHLSTLPFCCGIIEIGKLYVDSRMIDDFKELLSLVIGALELSSASDFSKKVTYDFTKPNVIGYQDGYGGCLMLNTILTQDHLIPVLIELGFTQHFEFINNNTARKIKVFKYLTKGREVK